MTRKERIEELVALLESEEAIYEELRSLLQQEREHMATLDPKALASVVEAKELTAAEARFVEESRTLAAAALARELELQTDAPTLSELCTALGPLAGPLRDMHARLVAVLGAVRELVDANASFAGDSLVQVRDALRAFARMAPAETTYGAGDSSSAVVAPGRLIRRSA